MTKKHTPTPDRLPEADIAEVTYIDVQGNTLWTGYSIGPIDGVCTVYDTPEQAYSAFLVSRKRVQTKNSTAELSKLYTYQAQMTRHHL